MRVQKAVITAAAPTQHNLPLQRLVDGNGIEKAALQLIVEEVVNAGVEDICVIICPGDREAFQQAAGDEAGRLSFVEQDEARGYGDAVHRARDFSGDQPFLHLVGDHLYLSDTGRCCAQQLISVANAESCSVSAVQATRENKLPYFGAVGGIRVPRTNNLYEISTVLEKPTPTQAEQELIVAGLRSGNYLCFFGMHVLTPTVMQLLGELLDEQAAEKPIALAHALARLAGRERYLALGISGQRYNIGVKYGLLFAQLALCLAGKDRDQILTELVELTASRRDSPAE